MERHNSGTRGGQGDAGASHAKTRLLAGVAPVVPKSKHPYAATYSRANRILRERYRAEFDVIYEGLKAGVGWDD